MSVRRQGKPIRQSVVEIISGIFTAHMMSDVIVLYVPLVWHSTGYFLVGMGGLALMGRLYESAEAALVRRVSRKVSGE